MSYYIYASAAMRYYMLAMKSGDREVGGYAKFHTDEHGNMIVTDLRPLKQESTQCYFEIDETTNALFLEQLVAEGEDPADWSMLFHTHPSGMGASMSGVDVKQLSEMASDLPGKVARSMILSQGKMNPTMHEAVCIDGRVFMRDDCEVTLLDDTGALEDLKAIGFFDKPKVVPITQRPSYGFTHQYGEYHAGVERSRSLVPERKFSSNDGWYDEAPEVSESAAWGNDSALSAEWNAWLDDKRAEDADDAEEWIGEEVMYHGNKVTVIDAYEWDGDIVLVLPDNTEMRLEDATMAVPDQQAQ